MTRGTLATKGVTLGENASLVFNFTEKDSSPRLVGTAVSGDLVNVKFSTASRIIPRYGKYVLTSGMNFTGKTVNVVDKPDWVKSVEVDSSGNLVLAVTMRGAYLFVR